MTGKVLPYCARFGIRGGRSKTGAARGDGGDGAAHCGIYDTDGAVGELEAAAQETTATPVWNSSDLHYGGRLAAEMLRNAAWLHRRLHP
jgi:hypothetical protein